MESWWMKDNNVNCVLMLGEAEVATFSDRILAKAFAKEFDLEVIVQK